MTHIDESLTQYEYAIQVHDDNSASLYDRDDHYLIAHGTSDECYEKIIEILGDVLVVQKASINSIYIWRA